MKLKILSLIVLTCTICSFTLQTKKKIVFFGDSITQLGAMQGGYILKVDSLCKNEGRSGQYEFVGAGIGGNKVYDLYLRMDDDVLAKNPDIVLIYVTNADLFLKRVK